MSCDGLLGGEAERVPRERRVVSKHPREAKTRPCSHLQVQSQLKVKRFDGSTPHSGAATVVLAVGRLWRPALLSPLQDTLVDLLLPPGQSAPRLEVKKDLKGVVTVPGATSVEVRSQAGVGHAYRMRPGMCHCCCLWRCVPGAQHVPVGTTSKCVPAYSNTSQRHNTSLWGSKLAEVAAKVLHSAV